MSDNIVNPHSGGGPPVGENIFKNTGTDSNTVYVENNSGDPDCSAIHAEVDLGSTTAITAWAADGPGIKALSLNGPGITAESYYRTSPAGVFNGNVTISGDATVRNITASGDLILAGADCAEEFDIVEATRIEPGTVMVIDQDGALQQSWCAYDKRVAGVISGAGDYKAGLILDRRQSQDDRMPVPLIGKVYFRLVSAVSSFPGLDIPQVQL